jgi:hypothetical protein
MRMSVADIFSVVPTIDPSRLSNLRALHRYIDSHLRVRTCVESLFRQIFGFHDKTFLGLLFALEEALILQHEDSVLALFSQMQLHDDVVMDNDSTASH